MSSPARFVVTEITPCRTCGGDGDVRYPMMAWPTTINPYGQAVHKCWRCSGTGESRREVELAEALSSVVSPYPKGTLADIKRWIRRLA